MNGHIRRWLGYALVVASIWTLQGQTISPREEAYRQNNLGAARLEQYGFKAAVGAFRRALEIDPNLAPARLNLAIAFLYDGDLAAANQEARSAADRIPKAPQSHYILGLIARASNRPADAIASFQRVLVLDPSDVGSRIQLGQLYLAERRFAEATSEFERALADEPFNATAAYGVALSLVRGGQRDAGERAMARFQSLRDNPAAVTYSANYLQQGRYGEALLSTGLEAELVGTGPTGVMFIDATAQMLGGNAVRGTTLLFDSDGDDDLDLLLGGQGALRLLTNLGGRFTETRVLDDQPGDITVELAGDYDNDGRPDLFVAGAQEARLYHQESDGTFRRMALAGTPVITGAQTAAFSDLDHDGDLDIFTAPPSRLLRNNGNGTFVDIAQESGLAGGAPALAVVPTDYDNRRDVDLLLLAESAPSLFANHRDGTFRNVASETGLPSSGRYSAIATGDINKDGAPDFFFARADGAGVFALSTLSGHFTLASAPPATEGATAAQLFDYDNDGLLDLFVLTPSGPKLLRSLGTSFADVSAASLSESLRASGDPPVAMAVGDLDTDGDADLIVRFLSGDVRAWRNDGGSRQSHLRVRLQPRVSNRSSIGAKIEIRAGSLRQSAEWSSASPAAGPADLLFGLGTRARADVVRVLWPSGILQAEAEPGAEARVVELNRKPSSCPFLFTWNGSRFEFVTDFMGGGETGAWEGPGAYGVPDPDEYVRIRGDQLQPRNGRYEIRVTNELEEALFVDRLQLVALAHSADIDVYPNEGLRSPAGRRPFTLFTTKHPRPPLRALDEHGHDVLESIRALDRRYVDDFALESIQGYAKEHGITMDLGTTRAGATLRLLLTGWTDYAFSSDNVAAHQAGLPSRPPSLQIKRADGQWQTVIDELGLPIGRPQTIVADLSPYLGLTNGHIDVRVVSTLRVYWDQILVDDSAPSPYVAARLEPLAADLRWRGFSEEVLPHGHEPAAYDYERVSKRTPWKLMPGRYTRFGRVLPLLLATDDRFVVSAAGDEIAISFDAASLPVLPDGWTRTFLLYADGFSKEMNLRSASPDQLDPMPFHSMSRYPYLPPEHYPRTRAHDRYRAEYNTRVIGRPLPPLALAAEK